jgi:hypothetical protein
MPLSIMNTVNTPDRLSLDAYADTERNSNAVYSSFNNTLGVAILNAKQLHLLRATIPNIHLQIPDYQLVFFYYNLPDASTVPNSTHLKAVRLYASDYVPPSGFSTYTKNAFLADPSALATLLTTAGAAGGDSVTYNKLWSSADVAFSYSTTTRQITFTGAGSGRYYANAGFADPNVLAVINNTATTTVTSATGDGTNGTYLVPSTTGIYVGSTVVITGAVTGGYNGTFTVTAVTANTSFVVANTTPTGSAFVNGKVVITPNVMLTYNFDTTTSLQPMLAQNTLNERVGYALSGVSVPPQSYGVQIAGVANLTGKAKVAAAAVPVDSYPCLVYSQNIYLYSTLVGNQGLGNYGRKNLIAVINIEVPSFGVIQFIGSYNGGEAHPVPDEIYGVNIEMRDDNNQPWTLPLSANVNIEIAVDYALPPYL